MDAQTLTRSRMKVRRGNLCVVSFAVLGLSLWVDCTRTTTRGVYGALVDTWSAAKSEIDECTYSATLWCATRWRNCAPNLEKHTESQS